jgi:hypothetical protein
MKRIVFVTVAAGAALFALTSIAAAQVPSQMHYQGYLSSPDGSPLDTTLSMTFTIYDDSLGSNVIWTETQPSIVVIEGLFNALLGSVIPVTDNVFLESATWLGIAVDPDPDIVPRTKLVTVPYAFAVSTVDGASGGSIFGDLQLHSTLTVGEHGGDAGRIEITDGTSDVIVADGTSGRMGIGTNTPSERLQVVGVIYSSAGGFRFPDGTIQTTAATGGGGTGGGWTDDGSVVRLETGTDFVGIGTAAPGEKVDVVGNIRASGRATIGPGHVNTGENAFVAGKDNTASGTQATVGGGRDNSAGGSQAAVGGGLNNSAGGNQAAVGCGIGNDASGNQAAISGGENNTASGHYSAIPGGKFNNAIATNSLAAGTSAKANHVGSVVIVANSGMSKSDSVRSGGNEQMVLRADGNVYITNTGGLAPYDAGKLINTSSGAHLTTGGTWTNASSRTLKENLQPLDRQELLAKISGLPIEAWNYRDADERHIGPVSEDFGRAFDVGVVNQDGTRDDQHLAASDVAGVALAGVKELAQENQELRQIIEDLSLRIAKLEETNTSR